MKNLIFVSFLLITTCVFSQDIKKASSYFDAKQLDKAKTEVDGILAKNPTDPQALYLQSKVYGAIAVDPQLKSTMPEARMMAFESFKKAIDNDKANILILNLNKDKYKPIFDLYTGYFDAGAAAFNIGAASNNKADFEQSLTMFKNADMVGHYIYTKKWALSDIDTGLVLTIGKAAINAGKKDETLLYFKKLADANIYETHDDKTSFQLPYQWLAYHYKEAKDEANFLKYADLGKKYFPKDDYFDALKLDYYRDQKNYDALFKQYDLIVASYPDSLQYHFNYANDAFTYIYNGDAGAKVNNKDVLMKSMDEQLQKALSIKADDINTNWLSAQLYFNTGVDIKDKAIAIKTTAPADVKQKADYNAQAKVYFNKAVPFADKALTLLENNGYKKSDKSKYKSISDLQQRIFQGLQQPDKVKIYQAKYDGADTKFVN